jgi:hypothetical protein
MVSDISPTSNLTWLRLTLQQWASKMRQHERCNNCIRDLIDVAMDKMLVIDPKGRATAKDIAAVLTSIAERTEKDPSYCQADAQGSCLNDLLSHDDLEMAELKDLKEVRTTL